MPPKPKTSAGAVASKLLWYSCDDSPSFIGVDDSDPAVRHIVARAENPETAKRIVQAVNAHAALVSALAGLVSMYERGYVLPASPNCGNGFLMGIEEARAALTLTQEAPR